MIKSKQSLNVRKPDFEDQRGIYHLLIWADIAHWMVVDDELLMLLDCFDGKRTLRQIFELLARRLGRPTNDVLQDAFDVCIDLHNKGILYETGASAPRPEEPVRIANITLNITNQCNLHCMWCYNAGHKTDELDANLLMQRIRAGRSVMEPDATLSILGGEPFLVPERLDCVLQHAETFLSTPILISTNGTLLTKEAVSLLAKRKVEVQVSIDSPFPEQHNAIRGEGVFERAVEGVKRLVSAGVPTIMSMVYTRENYEEIEAYLELGKSLGVGQVRFIPLRQLGGGLQQSALAPDQLAVFRYLMVVIARRPEFTKLLGRDFFSILYTTCQRATRRQGCGVGRRVIFIDADGRVYPCPNHVRPEFVCGELHTHGLADIFTHSSVMAQMRNRYDITTNLPCSKCVVRQWCAGDCRGESLALTGDPHAPSPHCSEMQAVIKEIFWRIADGKGLNIQGVSCQSC